MFIVPKESWEIKKTKRKGRGVFALRKIKKGTVIGEYSGKLMPYHEVNPTDYPYLMYFNDEKGIVADKNKVGVHLLNHSCDPNCLMRSTKSSMCFVAKRDIEIGEELMVSYMYPPQETCTNCQHKCFCGSSTCLGTMHTMKDEYDAWQEFLKT